MNNVIRKHGQHSYPKKNIVSCFKYCQPSWYGGWFFAEEMTRPFYDFIIAGYDVDVASPNGGG